MSTAREKSLDARNALAVHQLPTLKNTPLSFRPTASARQAKLLRVGGPSLKALPAIGIGAGVVFATNAAADQTSEIRGASVNGDGPAPMRLEKSNIGTSDHAELDAPDVRNAKQAARENSLRRRI